MDTSYLSVIGIMIGANLYSASITIGGVGDTDQPTASITVEEFAQSLGIGLIIRVLWLWRVGCGQITSDECLPAVGQIVFKGPDFAAAWEKGGCHLFLIDTSATKAAESRAVFFANFIARRSYLTVYGPAVPHQRY